MSYALPYPKFRAFVAATNLPLVGGKLTSYTINTTTPKALYADPELTTPLSNPVILDSNGEATIYGNGLYDLKLTTSADVLVWTADSVAFDQAAATTTNTSLEWVGEITTGIVYLSTTSFSLTGDLTATWHVNRRVKVVLTASTLYGTITSSSFAAGVTTIVLLLDSGTLSNSITNVFIGILDSLNGSVPRSIPWLALANTFTAANTFNAAVTVAGAFTVTGNQTVSGTLGVTGALTASAALSVGTTLSVTGASTLTGNVTASGTVAVTGAITGSAPSTLNALGVNVAAPAAGVIASSGDINAGGLVYAPNGFKQPGTGGETLKFIRGIVDSAGAVIEGAGFTSVRNSTGNFTITFSTAFSDIPSFAATVVSAGTGLVVRIVSASSSQVNYLVFETTVGTLTNADHHILVMGPK